MKGLLQLISLLLMSYIAFGAGHTVIITSTDILCNGKCTGTANAITTGGTGTFIYSWSNGSTNQSISNLCSESYTCTVTDTDLTISTAVITIKEPEALLITNSTTEACCGLPNGSASAIVSGGSGTYSFQWSNGASGQTAQNLYGGTYKITITDSYGCIKIDSLNINWCKPPTVLAYVIKSISCANDLGPIAVNISGGSPPFTYNWSNGSSSTTTASHSENSSVMAGSYSVTITDNSGCEMLTTVLISSPLPISSSISSTAATGNNSDGSISTSVSGGVSPYTLNWMPGNYTGSTINNLPCGTYSLTITDINNCKMMDSVKVECITGLHDNTVKCNYKISPNPTSGLLFITDNFLSSGNSIITINNILGETVFILEEIPLSSLSERSINLEALPEGSYILTILQNDKRFHQRIQKVNK